jgi:transglutaminase-like putative cysteine protease
MRAVPEPISPLSADRRIRLAAYVGVLAAYLAAARNDPLTPGQVAFFVLAALWSLAVEHRFRKPFFSTPIKIGLIAVGGTIFILFIAGNVGGTAEHFANSISRFLFWNAIVFVLSRNKTEYDFWTLAIIELSLFMISGSFVQPPTFLPLLLVSVTCLFATFQRAAVLKCGVVGDPGRGGIWLSLLTLALTLEVAAVVFVAFPRQSFRMEKAPGSEPAERTSRQEQPQAPLPGEHVGMPRFAAFLKLTNFQKLKTDPTPVLRIRIRDLLDQPVPPEQTLYVRGAVLDTYENGEWKTDFRKQMKRDADDGTIDGWTELERNVPSGRKIVRQTIQTIALSEDLAFALPDPVSVGWKEARYDPSGVLFFPAPPQGVVEYRVDSALMPAQLPASPPRGPAPERYLQLPPGLDLVRMTARRVTDSLGDGRNLRAGRLVHYLTHNGFSYKLDPFVPVQGKDPAEHFLETRTGYCVHFATALALLCRAAGVPARVATGFQLHDPEEDGSFLVRNSDAHAWVEVWFGPEHGWRVYDATPGAIPDAATAPDGAPVASVEDRKNEKNANRRWDSFVTDFDPATQAMALGGVARRLLGGLAAVARGVLSPLAALHAAAIIAVAGLVYALLPRRRKNRLRQMVAGFREPTTVDFYRDFLWTLSKRGFRKHPALTAREFAAQVRASIPDEGIDYVTEKFCEARYRGTPPEVEDLLKIDAILRRLSQVERPHAAGTKSA